MILKIIKEIMIISNLLIIAIGQTIFTAKLVDNTSVAALKDLLSDSPLTVEMSDYASMEKGGSLPYSLPQNNVQMNAVPGDIILYQGKTLVIYYDTNSYSLTPIGKIEDVTQDSLKKVLGTENVNVTFSLANHIYDNGATPYFSPAENGSLTSGQIIGIVIGCIAGVAVIIVAEFFIVRYCINKPVNPT